MPSSLSRAIRPEHWAVLAQFLRFGVVGASGFAIDTAVVYSTRAWIGIYGAGALAYVFAASSNWLLNRAWTFRGAHRVPAYRQWVLFLTTNLIGFALNRGTFALLVTFNPLFSTFPVLAVAAGTGAGMFINFLLSRRVVFR